MTVKIDTYYDFRSPHAYFADYRVRNTDFAFEQKVEWVGHPIFIDVILNLQLGNEPWAAYIDTLVPPKRSYLMADIRRMAQFYGAPYNHRGSGQTGPIKFLRSALRPCSPATWKPHFGVSSSMAYGMDSKTSPTRNSGQTVGRPCEEF